MWVCFNSELNKEYSRKFKQLQASLRNDDNYELRIQLLTGKIEPLSVTQLKTEQLAPRIRHEHKERQLKQNFSGAEEEANGGNFINKTDQGIENV